MDYFVRKDFPATLCCWDYPRKDFPKMEERLTLSDTEFGLLGRPNGLLCEEGLPSDAVLLGLPKEGLP